MPSPLRIILPLALLAGLFAQNLTAATPTEIYARASQAVLVLEGRDADGSVQLQASATALGDGVAVTQCDRLDSAEKWVVIQASKDFIAYPRERDEARNLCRLDVPGLRAAKPDIVPLEQVRVGQRVYAIGNALGLGLSLSEGLVSGIRAMNGESWLQTTAALAPGSEGGALFDEQGRLLGVTDYRKRAGQNVNFAAPAAWLPHIAGRAGQPDGISKLRSEANRLARVNDWKGLAEVAMAWSRLQPEASEPWSWLGAAREGLQDNSAAAEAYEKALARTPDSVAVRLDVVRMQLLQNQAVQALETLRPGLDQNQEDTRLWFAKGVTELMLGHAEEAEKAFQETVRLDVWHASAWSRLFETAIDRGDYRAAQQAASHLTEIDPTRADYWLRLAQAQLNLGRPARAMIAVDRAGTLAPDNPEVLFRRGLVLDQQGQHSQAIDALKRSLAAKPLQPDKVWRILGNVYYRLRLYPEAIAALREAVKLAPEQLSYQGELGVVLKDSGQDEEALKLFLVLRDKTPQDPFPWRQVGYMQSKFGRNAEAIPELEQSLRLAPNQVQVWHVLGECYALAGRPDDARRAYQRLRGLNPERAEQLYRAYVLPLEAQP
ncbi:MAG: tetratricopeptide repeat protein [Pseudomonadota bacterium]|nr:tetratricopeptide repeat protein [Pseudomonadota bacterium]